MNSNKEEREVSKYLSRVSNGISKKCHKVDPVWQALVLRKQKPLPVAVVATTTVKSDG
jgi:hypothetical protein